MFRINFDYFFGKIILNYQFQPHHESLNQRLKSFGEELCEFKTVLVYFRMKSARALLWITLNDSGKNRICCVRFSGMSSIRIKESWKTLESLVVYMRVHICVVKWIFMHFLSIYSFNWFTTYFSEGKRKFCLKLFKPYILKINPTTPKTAKIIIYMMTIVTFRSLERRTTTEQSSKKLRNIQSIFVHA